MNPFERVFKALNKAKIKYLVVGGVAVNLYGYARFTGDLDLILLLEEGNLKKMDKVMKGLKYTERLPISLLELNDINKAKNWLKKKNLRAFSYTPPKEFLLQIDIMIDESLQFEKIYKKRVNKYIDKVKIPLISLDDLIQMKRRAGREQDKIDLKALFKLKKL